MNELSYSNLGNAYSKLGDYPKAIKHHESALEIATKLQDKVGMIRTYGNLGITCQKLRDYLKAIEHHEKALKFALELEDRLGEARAYGNLGRAYQELKDYQQAINYHQKDLQIALDLNDRLSKKRAYHNLGIAYRYKDNSLAEAYFRQCISISADLQQEAKEAKWQISIFEELSQPYIQLEKILLNQKKTDDAQAISDTRRARALFSLISEKFLSKNHQDRSLNSLTIQEIQALAKKFHTIFIMYSLSSLNSVECSVQAWIIPSKNASISSVSLPISDQEFLNPEQIFKSFPYQAETKCPQRRERKPGAIFKEKLSSWYNCLIAPLEMYLPSKDSEETLTFIPEGFLAHLPFGSFYNQEEDKYLIENYPVSIAPSIGVLSLLDQLPKNDGGETLLMGNPTTVAKELDELKLAQEEVCRIVAPLLGLSQDEVFIQEKATPMCVLTKAPTARFMHIACHGIANQKPIEKPNPHSVFEGLFKLAIDDDHRLGHLHAEEIASMSLKADLVFMSACHLGRGHLTQEGSIGPIWSFLAAGARSTVASYWPLPEAETTVKIVETFYKHYLGIGTPKVNKAHAVRQAVLMAMTTEKDNPHRWGSLFLSGLIE